MTAPTSSVRGARRESRRRKKQRPSRTRHDFGGIVEKPRHWEKAVVIALCLAAAIRVFVFSAAFPFFNNVDEQAQVDLVLKYGRGHWPNQGVEHFDSDAGRLFVLYGTPEYFYGPEKFPGGVLPRPLWQTRALTDDAVSQAAASWTQNGNHEANSPPVYYVLAGVWYDLGGLLGGYLA